MVDAPDAPAGDLAQSDACALHLPGAGTLLQLLADLDDLCDAGCAWRVSLGQQAAARIDRNPAAQGGGAAGQQLRCFAAPAQPQCFVVQQLGNGESVVQLD